MSKDIIATLSEDFLISGLDEDQIEQYFLEGSIDEEIVKGLKISDFVTATNDELKNEELTEGAIADKFRAGVKGKIKARMNVLKSRVASLKSTPKYQHDAKFRASFDKKMARLEKLERDIDTGKGLALHAIKAFVVTLASIIAAAAAGTAVGLTAYAKSGDLRVAGATTDASGKLAAMSDKDVLVGQAGGKLASMSNAQVAAKQAGTAIADKANEAGDKMAAASASIHSFVSNLFSSSGDGKLAAMSNSEVKVDQAKAYAENMPPTVVAIMVAIPILITAAVLVKKFLLARTKKEAAAVKKQIVVQMKQGKQKVEVAKKSAASKMKRAA